MRADDAGEDDGTKNNRRKQKGNEIIFLSVVTSDVKTGKKAGVTRGVVPSNERKIPPPLYFLTFMKHAFVNRV